MKNNKGFTLVEIIVVLLIMSILAAMAAPAITGYIEDSNNSTYLAMGKSVLKYSQVEAAKLASDNPGFSDGDLQVAINNRLTKEELEINIIGVTTDPNKHVKTFEFTISGKIVKYDSTNSPTIWIAN